MCFNFCDTIASAFCNFPFEPCNLEMKNVKEVLHQALMYGILIPQPPSPSLQDLASLVQKKEIDLSLRCFVSATGWPIKNTGEIEVIEIWSTFCEPCESWEAQKKNKFESWSARLAPFFISSETTLFIIYFLTFNAFGCKSLGERRMKQFVH